MSDQPASAANFHAIPSSAPAAAPADLPTTPELRREAVAALMAKPEYTSTYSHERAPLVRRVRELLAADHPDDDRPRDEFTGEVTAAPDQAAPASAFEIATKISDHVSFPATVPDAEREGFRDMATSGLAALGATAAETGHFALAVTEVLKAPDRFTRESAETALRREWGTAYDANLRAAHHGLAQLPPTTRAELANSLIANHPRVVRLLADAGRRAGFRG